MKKFLVIGIIAILAIKRTENNTVVDNTINSIFESAIKNDANTTDEVVSDNGDVDTYHTLLLDEDVYGKNGGWISSHFAMSNDAVNVINLYYQNDSKHNTIIEFYKVSKWGDDEIIDSFTVSPGHRVVNNPGVKRGASYYIMVSSDDGGIIKGNLRVAAK